MRNSPGQRWKRRSGLRSDPEPGSEGFRFGARRRSEEAIVTSLAIALIVAAVPPGSASAAVQRTQDKVRSALSTWFKSEGQARTRDREQARKAVRELIDFAALARSTRGKTRDEI